FVSIRLPPRSILFPYTTLFRSIGGLIMDSDIEIRSYITKDSLFDAVIENYSDEELIDFIMRIDGYISDTQFTKTLRKKLKNTIRSEEHTSELQSRENLVCRLLL